jgi:hypothetical protein
MKTTSAIILIAFALAGCAPKKGGGSSSTATVAQTQTSPTSSSTGTSTGTGGDPTTIAAYATAVGTRNFDQINATMESVTGVMGNATIKSRFTSLKGQLPSDNDVKSFSFSSQGAVTVLAAEYCTALVTNSGGKYATQLAAAIGNFNITAVPTVAFTNTTSPALAQSLILKFWGNNYATSTNAALAQSDVVTLMAGLVSGQANTATTTRNAVIGACTSVLASAPVSVY